MSRTRRNWAWHLSKKPNPVRWLAVRVSGKRLRQTLRTLQWGERGERLLSSSPPSLKKKRNENPYPRYFEAQFVPRLFVATSARLSVAERASRLENSRRSERRHVPATKGCEVGSNRQRTPLLFPSPVGSKWNGHAPNTMPSQHLPGQLAPVCFAER